MLTIDLSPQTEVRINLVLAEMDQDDVMPAPVYVLMLLGDLLQLDLNQTLKQIIPHENAPQQMERAESESILNDAVRQMKENQVKNRDRAVETITRKNRLSAEAAALEREEAYLKQEAMNALCDGDRELAKARLKERVAVEESWRAKAAELAAATNAADDVKQHIRQEEERLREQAAQALATANRSAAFAATNAVRTLYRIQLGRLWGKRNSTDYRGQERAQEETMRIDLDLPEEVEAAIGAEAERRGLAPQEYVARIVDGIATLADLITPQAPSAQDETIETHEETAEEIISAAIRELKECQIPNRERAVKVITHRSNLTAEIEKVRRLVAELERKSHMARHNGNQSLALAFYREKLVSERTLEMLLPMLAEVEAVVKQVKDEIRREEDHMRARVVEAMLLRIGMKAQAITLRYRPGGTEPDGAQESTLEADFEWWAAEYDRQQSAVNAAISSEPEDVDTTLRQLEERLCGLRNSKDSQ